MPKLVGPIVAVCLLATAASAKELDWRGTLSLVLTNLGTLEGSGTGVATLSEGFSLEALAVSEGILGTAVVPITDPIVTVGGPSELRLSAALGVGSLAIDPFGAGSVPTLSQAALPVPGSLRLCLFFTGCNSGSLTLPFTDGDSGVGLGGTVVAYPYGSHPSSLVGAPWTIQTASVQVPRASGPGSTTLYAFGSIHGPRSFTFTAGSTTQGEGGSIQLVTPVRIEGISGAPAVGFTRLQLSFLPESPLGVPLALGAAVLLALGSACRGRRRSRSDGRRARPVGRR